MAQFSATSQLNKHADKTLEILASDGGPSRKVITFSDDAVQQRANAAAKRKLESASVSLEMKYKELRERTAKMDVKMQQEKSKRIKLEKELKKLQNPKDELKTIGGPAKGTGKINLAKLLPPRSPRVW